MDFGLARGPLTSESSQEHYLSFHRFNVVFGTFGWSVLVAPDVQRGLREFMPPRVAVIAIFSLSVESHAEPCPHRLARYPNVDEVTVNRNDVQFGESGSGEPGELSGAFRAGHGEFLSVERECIPLWANDSHPGSLSREIAFENVAVRVGT